ncbi:immunity 50 family protein [Ralstonia sp. UBA689]|uniref:immunity 50 family protein n=1 Tax=Ralstonia sp. UBA689 TaxID=1947373 RepID=UPI0025E37DAA|nr:immunity 50 family protein [Ralstonia sp. UBA689]
MNTHDRVMNPQALTSLYGDFPSLNGAELIDANFQCNEPLLTAKFVTREKPRASPKRWPQHYDEVIIELSFIGVRRLLFREWDYKNTIDRFELDFAGNRASVRISCESGAALEFLCDWMRIESVNYGLIGTP